MTFRSLPLLWLLAVVPLALLLLVVRERARLRLARRFVAERLRGVANPARVIRPYIVTIALAAALFALAGPSVGFTMTPVEEHTANRVIAIDVSRSMGANDVGTTRLEAAKALARRIIDAHEGRVGLIVFESGAEVVSPLTTDGDAVAQLADSLQPGELSQPGTDLGSSIAAGLRLLEADPGQKGDIVVISDGEDQEAHMTEGLRQAKLRGVPVSTITVGQTEGSTIPQANGRPLQKENGQWIFTYAHPEVMRTVAEGSGGHALVNPFGDRDLDVLVARGGSSGRQKMIRTPIDRYQWPLAFAFVALICGSIVNRGAE